MKRFIFDFSIDGNKLLETAVIDAGSATPIDEIHEQLKYAVCIQNNDILRFGYSIDDITIGNMREVTL